MSRQRDWILEPYNSGNRPKYICPQCQDKGKTYVRYINTAGEYAPYHFGKCERIEKCGHHQIPNKEMKPQGIKAFTPPPPKPQEFIAWQSIDLKLETKSNLFIFMANIFGRDKTLEAFKRYFVATEGHRVIFPYIDHRNRLTQAKTIEYDSRGHRTSKATWEAKQGRELRSCLFGSHLIEPGTTPHIVEGEKTALICSIVYPQYTWAAVGGLSMISRSFDFKEAVIYPDKGKAYEEWKRKCPNRFLFDRTVEESESLEPGEDLADLILLSASNQY